MKHLLAALTLSTLFASQAAALSVDITLPSLTWPEPATATQSCATPTQLAEPSCQIKH